MVASSIERHLKRNFSKATPRGIANRAAVSKAITPSEKLINRWPGSPSSNCPPFPFHLLFRPLLNLLSVHLLSTPTLPLVSQLTRCIFQSFSRRSRGAPILFLFFLFFFFKIFLKILKHPSISTDIFRNAVYHVPRHGHNRTFEPCSLTSLFFLILVHRNENSLASSALSVVSPNRNRRGLEIIGQRSPPINDRSLTVFPFQLSAPAELKISIIDRRYSRIQFCNIHERSSPLRAKYNENYLFVNGETRSSRARVAPCVLSLSLSLSLSVSSGNTRNTARASPLITSLIMRDGLEIFHPRTGLALSTSL